MGWKRKVLVVLVLIGLLSTLVMGPGVVAAAETELASTVIYNFYSTDAFVKMADGTVVYNYGFVGGRQGRQLVYQKSFSADGMTGGDNATLSDTPAPTGGKITSAEFALQGQAQFPAPMITAATGDVVEIRLKNLGVAAPGVPNDPHSVHLHGMDVDAANDGVPETSLGAVAANVCADGTTAPAGTNCATPAPGAGNVVVYMFSPKTAGTFFYHCHQEADIHVQMGMYGALIVYNPGEPGATSGPGRAGKLFNWQYDKDVVLLMTEIDVRQHCAELGTYTVDGHCPGVDTLPGQPIKPDGSGGWNPVDYKPQFWFLNGLSFPNTVHVAGGPVVGSWNNWLAAHRGYDPLVTGSVSRKDKVLLRMINIGFETQPMHMHGYHGKVIGSDQRAWTWANTPQLPFGMGLEKNTLTIGSGEEYDWLINFGLQDKTSVYAPRVQSRYNDGSAACLAALKAAGQPNPAPNKPVANHVTACPVIPSPETGLYVGGPTVHDTFYPADVLAPTGSQMFPFHNHDDYKATNNGAYPGGMFTMIVPLP